jgi:hypothetical protein
MKKFLLITVISALASFGCPVVTHAQTVGSFSQTASNSTGAITNTSVDTMTYTLARSFRTVTIQTIITKTSGTMAGWSVLDYSVDGTNWKVGTDTLSLANSASQNTIWEKTSAAKYWRIRTGGATTVAGTVAGKISAN